MPNRTYRADLPSDDCVTCRDGIVRFEGLTAPFLKLCPECNRRLHVAIDSGTAATVGAMDPRLASEPLYMSQAARRGEVNPRANPANYVSGPHSWQKKVDELKRRGARAYTKNEEDDARSPREIKEAERKNTL